MRIDLSDPRVYQALQYVKETHNIKDNVELGEVFESQYRCRLVADPNDVFCNTGWMEIDEEKYSSWFVLKFGDSA